MDPGNENELDPTYLNALRELKVVIGVFALFACYVIGTCYSFGRTPAVSDDGQLATTLGLPTWVFWGIVAPWCVAVVVTTWFSFWFMRDDPLGENDRAEEAAVHPASETETEGKPS